MRTIFRRQLHTHTVILKLKSSFSHFNNYRKEKQKKIRDIGCLFYVKIIDLERENTGKLILFLINVNVIQLFEALVSEYH